jgi:hypothetical protein
LAAKISTMLVAAACAVADDLPPLPAVVMTLAAVSALAVTVIAFSIFLPMASGVVAAAGTENIHGSTAQHSTAQDVCQVMFKQLSRQHLQW